MQKPENFGELGNAMVSGMFSAGKTAAVLDSDQAPDGEYRTALRFKNKTFWTTDESVEFIKWWAESGRSFASIDDMRREKESG